MGKFWCQERFDRLVVRQHGRITWAQLRALGASDATLSKWASTGRLVKVLPRVYAVGHNTRTFEASLWEAILYAGPGAMLSHRTAAHWMGLIKYPPAIVEVSTPRPRVSSLKSAVRVYARRDLDRRLEAGLPTTTIPQTLLDLARIEPALVARALAQLDYRRELDVAVVDAIAGRGKPGSRELRNALAVHQPLLAHTNSELEERFVRWCERYRVPLPQLNVTLHGFMVDAYWPEHGVVVELDGHANHSTPAQRRSDMARDLELRSHGLRVVRYGWHLLHERPGEMRADLMSQLAGTLDVEVRQALLQPGRHVPVGLPEHQHQRRDHD